MSRPTIVCIPGPCHPPDIYLPLRAVLLPHGYTTILISLPSIGRLPPIFDFSEDVIAIRSAIISLVEASQEIVVVMHGFNGVTGSQALHGLGKAERQQWGHQGGVIRLVFIMGWVVKEGFQAAPRGDVADMFSYMKVDPANGIVSVDLSVAKKTFYNDLSAAEAEHWTSKLQTQSLGTFWSKTSYAAWRYIPSTYILCGQDQCVAEEYALIILEAAKEDGRHMIDTIERCEAAGHCVMLSQVEWLANVLRRTSGEDIPT